MEWSAVECSAAAAELSRDLLATRETAFEAEREALVQVHQAARTELRQIERMVARAGNVAAATAERRAQRASDDRFLARREWLRVERQQSSA